MQLNVDQAAAVESLNGNFRIATLTGFPGTGKTTTLVEWLRSQKNKKVLLTATTNKAVGVLRNMVAVEGLSAECMTTASALGLKLTWKHGEQVLVPNTRLKGRPPVFHADVWTVDEMSMLGHTETEYVLNAQLEAGNRLILSGDSYQLPFVGAEPGEISPAFEAGDVAIALSKIERQETGPITELGSYLRELLNEKDIRAICAEEIRDFADGEQMIALPRSEVWPMMLADFVGNEAEDIRYISFTNKVVDKGVAAIRRELYGAHAPEYVVGERVQCLKPVIDPLEESVVFCTDQLISIESLRDEVLFDLPVWCVGANGHFFNVVKSSHKTNYLQKENTLKNAALRDRTKWRDFYRFVESFSYIRSAQGLTVHKSQGSTFKRCYVNAADILKTAERGDAALCNRLMNVASSRPSAQLVLAC